MRTRRGHGIQRLSLGLAAAFALLLQACAGRAGPVGNSAVPQPARPVALESYLGSWYEYARYENGFEKGCEGVTAEYARRADGGIRVVNTCRKGSPDGKAKVARGKAKIVPGSGDAKLKVSFFGPFWGNYWVLDHGEPGADGLYPWSIVGEPSGRYLWVLTREARPDGGTRAMLERRVRELGYDWGMVRVTRHQI